MRVSISVIFAIGATACHGSRDTAFPPHELSMRFTHPELYEGRDDFARPNALLEMLRRGILHRGQTLEEVTRLLGWPDSISDPRDGDPDLSVGTAGLPWIGHYDRLESAGFHIEFEGDWRERIARRFVMTYQEGPYLNRVDEW